ncbi:MAG: YihY/virulence factor BrkB family protein [Flavobacteriaceae bacterium]|nr:YihY/virulence factor BrkB family protein [Flavobacteriaceae bacterium]
MTTKPTHGIENWPIIGLVIRGLRWIQLPGFQGLSLYDLIEIYARGIIQGALSSRASSIAYSFFMAFFPFLLFMLNVLPYIPINNFQNRFLNFIDDLLPAQTHEFFYPVIEDIATNPRTGLLSFTFVLALFLMANGVSALFSAFEYSIHVTINRGFIRQYVVALMVAVFMVVLLIATLGGIVYGEYLINILKSDTYIDDDLTWILAMQYVFFVVMLYFVVATLYYFGVKKNGIGGFWSIGALATTILILGTTYGFGIYINNFSHYNELYGSIGALLIMLFYLWLNANLLLLGFELDQSLGRLKERQGSSGDLKSQPV